MPVGLCGELTINALVFGVTARRSPSTSIAKPRPSGTIGTARRSTARHRDDGGVGVVERLDQQHLGARLDEAEHRRGDGLGGADGDQHLGVRVVLGAEVPFALRGDGLTQRCDAKPRRVLVDALGDGVLGGLEHRGRAVLVGKALPQVHGTDAGGQRRHLGEDRDRVGLQPRHRHDERAYRQIDSILRSRMGPMSPDLDANGRRLLRYLEQSIEEGTRFAVFEPNDERLWAKVQRSVADFLLTVWRSGALMGIKPEEACFVRCDRTTMTQDDLDNGRLVCLVGVAPIYPAEFVIFRVSQWTGDAKRP